MTENAPPAEGAQPLAKAVHGHGRLRVEAAALCLGEDLLVAITGGTHPHVGSVVVAEPRPSRAQTGLTSTTSSVINRLGHEDETVARAAADRLARELHRVVVVTAGLHVDNATPEEIAALLKGAVACVDQLMVRLRSVHR